MKSRLSGVRSGLWLNRSLSARFNILLTAIFLLGASTGAAVLWPVLRARAEAEVASKGSLLLEAMNAVRSYTNAHVVPLLSHGVVMGPDGALGAGAHDREEQFIPESVPAFSAREVFSRMREGGKTEGFVYREASVNPTNPLNRADDFEAGLLEQMRETGRPEYAAFREREGRKVYYVAHPMRMTSAGCLSCHGTPAMAPPSMVAQYGSENGFGWEMNDIIAAQIVYVPADEVLKAALHSFGVMVGATIITLTLVLLTLNVLLRRDIIRPVRTLGVVAGKLSADEPIANLPQSGDLTHIANRGDELGLTARLFRQMANEVYARTQILKQRVQDLRIEIDSVRRGQNVTEVVETDFFRALQSRARLLRHQRQGTGAPAAGTAAQPAETKGE